MLLYYWWLLPPLRKPLETWTFFGWRERNQQDSTNLIFIITLLSQHVSCIIMLIIRRTRVCTAAQGVLHYLCWLWLCVAGTRTVCTQQHILTQRVRLCCHNTDIFHINVHDRSILVIFNQALYKASWWWILCDPKHVGTLLIFYKFNCIYILYIVH